MPSISADKPTIRARHWLPRLFRSTSVPVAAILTAAILVMCAGQSFPAWAALQTEEEPSDVESGGELIYTDDAIVFYETDDGGGGQRIRWSVLVERSYAHLRFSSLNHGRCLFYLTAEPGKQIGLHALRIRDGSPLWEFTMATGSAFDSPRDPVFLSPWIYLGRGTWLERLDPETGTIVERYPMREIIQALAVSDDGRLEVTVETFDAGQVQIDFFDGDWSPHISASSSLSGKSLLMNRAMNVAPEFAGTLDPTKYQGYLDLYRVKREPISGEAIAAWRNFDVREAETAYARAAAADRSDPYLALFLALAHYYLGDEEAASTTVQEALRRSAQFWEESIRMGVVCDSLGHVEWADEFYEQGLRQYAQEIPAPAREISVDEVLSLLIQQQSSALFAAGRPDRALHLIDVRRRFYPYMEGDNQFSRRYAAWLHQQGAEERAQAEERRIGKRRMVLDLLVITPLSFVNFGGLAILLIFFVILKNDIRHWSEFIVLATTITVLDSVATMDLLGELNLPLRAGAHIAGLAGYVVLIGWLRHRRRDQAAKSWRKTVAIVAMSSYVLLLRGTLPAYYIGFHVTHSQRWAKLVEILFLVGFFLVYAVFRRRYAPAPVLRHGRLMGLALVVYLCWGSWWHQWGGFGIISVNFPHPWADKGHPNWVAYMDEHVDIAEFRHRDMQFLQALVYQLAGKRAEAEAFYQPLRQHAGALNNLGVLMAAQNQPAALDYFRHALKVDPTFAPALYNSGLLSGNQAAIEQARAIDAWLPDLYQQYAPDHFWIANPGLEEWCRTIYWSRGGFLSKSFLELMVRFTNPAELFQEDLRQLRQPTSGDEA